jgi:competence protein ComEC
MPPIARLTVALAVGVWLGLSLSEPWPACWAVAAAVAVTSWARPWWGTLLLTLLVGLLTGIVRAHRETGACQARWLPGPKAVLLRIHDAPSRRGTTSATILHAREQCDGVVRVRVVGDVPAGAVLLAVGTAYPGGVIRLTHYRVLARRRAWRYRIRRRIASRVATLYGPRAGLVEALVLGRRDDVPRDLRAHFARAGLAHLLAISGLHVGVIAGWVLVVLHWAGVGRRRWVIGAAVTWLYVALLGFPAPATRAAAFVALHAIARLRQRHPSPSAVLAVAVVILLQMDPGAVTAVGAWLSVAAVAGTSWGRDIARERGFRGWGSMLVASSTGATLFTAPITAWSFGSVAPIGVVANLAAIPIASLAVPALMLSLGVGQIMAGSAGLLLAGLERVAQLAGGVPLGSVTGNAGPRFAIPWCVVLVMAVMITRRGVTSWRRTKRTLAIGAVAVWVPIAVPAWVGRDRDHVLSIHVLDVGQGDAIVVRTPRGRWLLVDGGPHGRGSDAGRRVVLPFLRRHGVDRLDAVIVSHGDADHLGGIPTVLRSLDVALVLEPGQPVGTGLYLDYLAAVDRLGVPWRTGRTGDTVTIDSVTLAVLHPRDAWVRGQLAPNENSLVVHLRYGCFDALLTGDVGSVVERDLLPSLTPVEVLKVGHHGSAGGTEEAWLDVLTPQVAVISVGPNRYGHPAPSVLERLADRQIDTWRTDRHGTVTISTDGGYLWVTGGRPATLARSVLCRIRHWLRLSGSSSNRSGCTPRPPATSPICSTTSPSPRR